MVVSLTFTRTKKLSRERKPILTPLVDLMDGTNLKEEKLGNSKNADTIQVADPVTNEFRLFYPSEIHVTVCR